MFFVYGDKLTFDDNAGHWTLAPRTGGSSGWAGRYVNMPKGNPEKNLLAHEVGHYLHCMHPFVGGVSSVSDAAAKIKEYVESNGLSKDRGLEALDGDRDFVLDTPADAKSSIFVDEDLDKCGAVAHIDIPVMFSNNQQRTYTLAPDRLNVMSYFKDCHALGTHHLSSHQIRRLRNALEDGNRHELVTRKAAQMSLAVTRRGTGTAGAVGDVEVFRVSFRRLITAVRDGDGDLKVVAWDVSADGNTITRKGDAQAGGVSQIACCDLGLGHFATAVRTAAGTLKVILWRATSGGQIERLQDGDAGAISEIAVCRLGTRAIITAVRNGSGELQMIAWRVTADGRIVRRAEQTAGQATQISMCPLGDFTAATALRDSAGNLKLITWESDTDGDPLTRSDDASAGEVSTVSVCQLHRDLVVTAVRDSAKNLKLIAWHSAENGTWSRRDDAGAGEVTGIAACRIGIDSMATAVTDATGDLKLIAWKILNGGARSCAAGTGRQETPPGSRCVGWARTW